MVPEHPTDDGKQVKPGRIAACILWSIWAFSALQLVVLVMEFGDNQLEHCGNEAWYYARFYSHMFLYPVTFGLVSTIFLTRPLIAGIDYLHSLPKPKRTSKFAAIAGILLLTVLGASYAEFTQSTGAIWAFSPETLSKSKIKAREVLENRCSETNNTGDSFKNRLEQIEQELKKDKKPGSSWTEMAYYSGFPSMAFLFTILFVTISIAIYAGEELRQRMMSDLTLALLFASFWVLMRITFMVEKYSIFATKEDQLFYSNFLIFAVFFLAYILLFHFSKSKKSAGNPRSDKWETTKHYIQITLWILQVLLATVGYSWMPSILIRIFGTGSDWLSYFFIFLLLIFAFFLRIQRALEGGPKPERS